MISEDELLKSDIINLTKSDMEDEVELSYCGLNNEDDDDDEAGDSSESSDDEPDQLEEEEEITEEWKLDYLSN